MTNNKLIKNIISLLVAFIMTFSCIPVYADRDTQTGGGGSGGTAGKWSVTTKTGGEEFIRCSIWFYKGGINVDKNPTPVGYAIDLRSPKYASLRSGTPTMFSDATENNNTARHYNFDGRGYEAGSHYYGAVMENAVPGETKEEYEANKGNATLEFPILFTANGANGGNNGVDAKEYFSNYIVHNNLLASVQGNRFGTPEQANGQWQDIDDMESGIYHEKKGDLNGQYIILLEPGIYCKMNGSSAALTFRDCIALNVANNFLHQFVDPPQNCANSLMVGEDWMSSLGLTGSAGIDQLTKPIYEQSKLDEASKKLGAGVITCSPSVGQIPVINYYYDLTVPGGLVGTGLEDIKTVWTPILSEDTPSFDKVATTSTKVKVTGNEYKAPLISSPQEGGRQYKLVMGFMSLKDDLDGNLDIKEDWRLQFYDALNLGQISKEESLEDLLAQSIEIQGLNNRTNIVTNYINFIDRNIGNDTSISD